MASPQNKEAQQNKKDVPFGIFSFKMWVPGYATWLFEKHFPPQTFPGNGCFQLTKIKFLMKKYLGLGLNILQNQKQKRK